MSRLGSLLLFFLLGSVQSSAQDEGHEQLEKCASLTDDAARLACFDSYARQVRSQDSASLSAAENSAKNSAGIREEPPQSSDVSTASDSTQTNEREIRAATPAEIKQQPPQRSDGLPVSENAQTNEREAQAAMSADVEQKQPPSSSVSSVSEDARTEEWEAHFGLPETPEPEQTEPAALVARVETFTRLNRSNNIRITLDNGQVWQEIDGKSFRGSVKPGTEVTISERRFGGYRMKISNRSSVIFVRRIK